MLKITAEERAALPQWFRPKTQKDNSSRIAERRDVILRELQAAGKLIFDAENVALLLEKHGLRVSQLTVMNDLHFLAERFPVLTKLPPSPV